MGEYVTRGELSVDTALAEFIETGVLAPLGRDVAHFWQGFSALLLKLAPRNAALLATRNEFQGRIDAWHRKRRGDAAPAKAYREFLADIGYLVRDRGEFTIGTENVDPEVAVTAGPQLVVPVLNARFLLNAANARWGSLYDALYGTDVLDAPPALAGTYDEARGKAVIAEGRRFLDDTLPLAQGTWVDLTAIDSLELADPAAYVGTTERGLLFRHNGLHIELVIDPAHPVGRVDTLHIADIVLEAALTTIVDLEDSVAAVDAADKLAAYRNWLGLIRGDLEDRFKKNDEVMTRRLATDKQVALADGKLAMLPGRSLLFVRNVGHLMSNPAILLADGSQVPEGILDAVVTSAIGALDVAGLGRFRNSRAGSIYIVKPKMHGPQECAFTNDMFDAIEDLLGIPRYTIKVGVMDEERRTSANLSACIHAVKDRIVFINTGFLDRTGDEIHTSMLAGPMLRKGAMKDAVWLKAYEARNVAIGLKHGFSGRAQIGKGMWAAPDKMREMMEQKIAHPRSGANTAWVPSPTAAVLHAIHYHAVDVFTVQKTQREAPELDALLTIPLARGANWSEEEIAEELDNNCQGLLGYVVRWVDQGVGCSTVPDINDVGLMEDRATLRISSQHIANWLLHGVVNEEQVTAALRRMAAKVDTQNAGDPAYEPLTGNEEAPAFQAARDLIFGALDQPNGYTEPLLHRWRAVKKADAGA